MKVKVVFLLGLRAAFLLCSLAVSSSSHKSTSFRVWASPMQLPKPFMSLSYLL